MGIGSDEDLSKYKCRIKISGKEISGKESSDTKLIYEGQIVSYEKTYNIDNVAHFTMTDAFVKNVMKSGSTKILKCEFEVFERQRLKSEVEVIERHWFFDFIGRALRDR